jgi:phage terminase small subunit
MSGDAQVIWRQIIAAADPNHFREIDRTALREYAEAAARCHRAEAALREQGDVVSGRPNAWLAVLKQARFEVANLSTKLRLVPSARTQPVTITRGEGRGASLATAAELVRRHRES